VTLELPCGALRAIDRDRLLAVHLPAEGVELHELESVLERKVRQLAGTSSLLEPDDRRE
jgi:hypothetical protein